MRADTAKIEEWDISTIYRIKNKPQGKKNKPFFKINPCYESGELHLFKDCPFKHKNAILAGTKDTNSHTADFEGEIIQKIKNGYSTQLNKQPLKKYK